MAFINALFPNPKLISGLQVGFMLPTTIVGSGSSEYRIQKLQHFKKKWVWPSRAMSTVDRRIIQNFLIDTARFSLNSFKFLDPDNNNWSNTPLAWASSSSFYLTERGGADTHPIFRYDTNVVVMLNGSPVSVTQTTFNGLPVIVVPGANSGSNVTISGTFFFAARYDSADFNMSLSALQWSGVGSGSKPFVDTVDNISLIEVFE